MHRPLVAFLLTITACGSDDAGDGPDAFLGPLTCTPPATAATMPTASGPAPVGAFQVAWTCESGCDGTKPMVIFQTNSIRIDTMTRESGFVTGEVAWLIDGSETYSDLLELRGNCWYRYGANGGCVSDYFICDSGSQLNMQIAIRDPDTGVEQIWRMR